MAALKNTHESVLLERLEESVTCPVCMDIYDDPRRLICGHVFCLKCLESIALSHNQVEYSSDEDLGVYDEVMDLGVSSNFNCPVCRREQKIPSKGLSGLEKDRIIQDLVDTIKKVNGTSQGALYGNVEEEPDTSRCAEHKQKLGFWCVPCQVSICSQCILGQHNGHKLSSITDKQSNQNAPLPPPLPAGGFKTLVTQELDSDPDEYEELADDYLEPEEPVPSAPPAPPMLPTAGRGRITASNQNLAAVMMGGRGAQTGLRKVIHESGSCLNLQNTHSPRIGAGFGIQSEAIAQARGGLRSRPQASPNSRPARTESPSQDSIRRAVGGLKPTAMRKHLTDPHLVPKAQQNPHVFNQPKLRSVSESNLHQEVDIYTNTTAKAKTLPTQNTSPFGQGMLRPTKNRERFLSEPANSALDATQEKPSNLPLQPAKKVPPPVKQKTWKPNFQNSEERKQMRQSNRRIFKRESIRRRNENNARPAVSYENQALNNPLPAKQYENHALGQRDTPAMTPSKDRGSNIPELENILQSGRWQDLTAQLETLLQNQGPKVDRPQIQQTKKITNKTPTRPSPQDFKAPTVYENVDSLSFALKSYRIVDDINNYSFD